MRACDAHKWRDPLCPDCHALNSSVATRTLDDDIQELRRAFNFEELIREVEAHLRGEVRADD